MWKFKLFTGSLGNVDLGGLEEQEIVEKWEFPREGGIWPMGGVWADKSTGRRKTNDPVWL